MNIRIVAEASDLSVKQSEGWGLSFLIDEDILFDTFSDGLILKKNIKKQEIDIMKLKYVVISHDHWDHTGGLWHILSKNPKVKVFICPCFTEKTKEKMRKYTVMGTKIIELQSFTEIKKDVFTTGEIMGNYSNKPLPEQSLAVKTQKGLVIITGCAHPGIINIIDKIKKQFNENIYLVMGGFHLMDSNREQILEVVSKMKSYGINKVAPMHCTGAEAVKMFKEEFRDGFISVKTGSIIDC
ncbi:MAG: hypothetical protein A3J83_05050 [Elusimicrobia bacterium RIFOXYA2_FULL_40_6]|nr:MAG: hypothetical protein A3J83_05050 [Elusimicrobia bacterium RIFOXYA2_FULL_40_6]